MIAFRPMALFRLRRAFGILIILALLIVATVSGRRSHPKCEFPAIFNFGDSNSDTGGFWAAFPAQHGPYGMTYFKRPSGRASDGRLVIDFLAQALGFPFLSPYLQSIGSEFTHGANFATLASTVLLPNTSVFVSGVSPFSLAIQLNQIKELKVKASESNLRGNLPPQCAFNESLYIFDIGQNDFTGNLEKIGIGGVQQYLPQVLYQIASTIKDLYDIGGRTFMVMNLAPIGCYPAFLVELPHNSSDLDKYGCMVSYNIAVDDYNKLLKETLHLVRDQLPNARIIYVDTHSVKLELFQHPIDHGFLYGTKGCCGYGGGDYNFDRKILCGNSKVVNGTTITATACEDPEKYVSWDGIHATEAANKLVTLAILNGSHFDPPFPLSNLCDLQPIG